MNCPTCGAHFHTTKFHGITVDRCPRCGGIWLGETQLAAIVARDVARGSSQFDRRPSPRGQAANWEMMMDDEDCLDESPYSHSYRLRDLREGSARPED
jgi:Zn-finger nucleic acid-binding protein